jgi:hypothetical protein
MALNFPNSPTLNQVYTDSTSGFSYQWNGTVWISFSAASSSQIKTLDDISSGFNNSTQTFALTTNTIPIVPLNAQSLIINLGGVIQDATDDYSVSGSNIVFSTAPTNGLSFSGVSLGPAVPVDYANNGNVYTRNIYTATASQTVFTITGTYTVGYIEVYQNGVRLTEGTDFTATNGTTFVLTTPANLNDEVVSVAYKVASLVTTTGQFDNLIISGVSTFVGFATHTGTIFGNNLSLTGIVTATEFDISGSSNTLTAGGLNVGIATASSVIVGSGLTLSSSGINITGITTIKNASGTVTIGIGTTALLVEGNARVTGILTVGSASITLDGATNVINVGTGLTLSSSGINITGIITATSFVGSGSGLTGVGIGSTGSINTSGIITASSFVGTASTASFATTAFNLNGVTAGNLNVAFAANAGISTFATNAGIATNLKGGVIGNIPYQSSADTTVFLTNGGSGTVLQSNGVGNAPSWIAAAPADAVTGLVVRDFNNNIVGTSGSVSQLTFSTGLSVTGTTGAAGIATITLSSNIVGTSLSISGISTFANGPVLIGSGTSTGTASQTLQVTGGAYVSGNLGIGTTNPAYPLQVQGNARVTGAIYDSTNAPGTTGQVLQSTITGTLWATAAAGGGGSGKFDTSIDNVIYVQPTGTLDIVGVGTTTTQITTLPSGSNKYLIHSLHVTNVSNGDAEITAGFVLNARKVPATISVSVGSSGGPGIHTFTVGSASSITVGMAVTGTGNIGETTGIGSTAGFQFNTYVTSVDGNNITLSKPMSGRATGTLFFSPVSDVVSRLPVPVGSSVELLKQPMILNALDSIVLQSTGAGSGIGSTSTAAISQTANSNFLTVTAGAAITNFLSSGMLIQPTGSNTGIQTNTFVGVGYTSGSLSIPMTRPAKVALASTSISFTEVVVPQDGALQVTVVYQSSTDTSYLNGTGTVVAISSNTTSVTAGLSTIPVAYYGTGNTYPSVVQSIRVSNISDGMIYPGGDYPVSVGIGNSDTVFSWLAYNMIIPKNSSIELCESPKRLGIGQSIFASSSTPNAIEIQIAAKQKTT